MTNLTTIAQAACVALLLNTSNTASAHVHTASNHYDTAGHGEHYSYTNHVITQRTLATGYRFYFEWDQLNPKAKCVKQGGDHGNYGYTFKWDEKNHRSSATNSRGHTTQYRYNHFGLITEEIDPTGAVHQNENGDTYRFFYDANERLIKEIGFDGRTQEYVYNPAGQLIQHRDANEVITTFERDPLGQLLQKHSHRSTEAPTAQHERARFRYDVFGRLTEIDNDHRYVQLDYDVHGHIVGEQQTALDNQGHAQAETRVEIQHRLNPLGQRTQTTLPDGQVITYDYDNTLGFNGVSLNNTPISQLQRDSLGRELTRQQGSLTTHTDYDPQGRLIKQHVLNKDTKHNLIQHEYDYDPAGNLRWIDEGGDKTVYVYDALQRLKHAANASPEFFAFDPAGNLLAISDDPLTVPGKVKGNRLIVQGDKKFEYDARGNLTQENSGKEGKLQKQFIYNLNNQLIKVQSNPPDQVIEFKYDSLGRRVEKRDAFGTTTFIWADNLLMQEQRNNTQKTYLYEPGSFRPLAQIQDGHIYHYHLDHLGTPRELTNNEGKIVWKAKYKTYGNLAVKEVEEIENNLRFQGQYYDPETGLHYNRFRYYSPETGQFINQDPIGLLGGLNHYQYVTNPVQWVDPWGLCESGQNVNKYNNLPVPWDAEYATKQLLGTSITPAGRHINFHAADRMVNPPAGRAPMTTADVDQVLDGATNIRKRSFHPVGNTLTIQNKNMLGAPQVVVDEVTAKRIITVINPKIKSI